MGIFARIFRSFTARRHERGRQLFEYWDGEQTRRGDPFRLQRALQNHSRMNLESMAPMVDREKEPETTIFVESIAEVFDVQRWDGNRGLTDWEILDLMRDFSDYLLALKKNTNLGPTSS